MIRHITDDAKPASRGIIKRKAQALASLLLLLAAPAFASTIPPGYSRTVGLELAYGNTPGKVPVDWGSPPGKEGETWGPSSMNGLRVLGDRFYFTSAGIRLYRSPGKFVWESPGNGISFFCVSPDGYAYGVWGTSLDNLSCYNSNGKRVWAVGNGAMQLTDKDGQTHMLPSEDGSMPIFTGNKRQEVMAQLGLKYMDRSFDGVTWTKDGPAVAIYGADYKGGQTGVIIFLDKNGKYVRAAPGSGVTENGQVFTYRTRQGGKSGKAFVGLYIDRKDATGKNTKTISIDLTSDNGAHLKGNPGFVAAVADPCGGFILHGEMILPHEVRINKRDSSALQSVFWRVDNNGKLREEWRFPVSCFEYSLEPSFDVDKDGNVYHTEYGDTGLKVVRYSRKASR